MTQLPPCPKVFMITFGTRPGKYEGSTTGNFNQTPFEHCSSGPARVHAERGRQPSTTFGVGTRCARDATRHLHADRFARQRGVVAAQQHTVLRAPGPEKGTAGFNEYRIIAGRGRAPRRERGEGSRVLDEEVVEEAEALVEPRRRLLNRLVRKSRGEERLHAAPRRASPT